jgi:hypothetical protein
MFIAAFFRIAAAQKQPKCPSIWECMVNKLGHSENGY